MVLIMILNELIGYRKVNLNTHITREDGLQAVASVDNNYIVFCWDCNKDPEMYGSGYFEQSPQGFRLGRKPCGCNVSHKTTEVQFVVKVKRILENTSSSLIRINKYVGARTKIVLKCDKHDTVHTTDLCHLNSKINWCQECKNTKVTATVREEDQKHISSFMQAGSFKIGTKFWRIDKKNSEGYKNYWNYTCPICSNDEYVTAGLCSGIFTGTTSKMKSGTLSCRCSGSNKLTEEQHKYRVEKLISDNKLPSIFISFLKNKYSRVIVRRCPDHGLFETAYTKFIDRLCDCPNCKLKSTTQLYINEIYNEFDEIVAIKFGITYNYLYRTQKQRTKSTYGIRTSFVYNFNNFRECYNTELLCKKTLKTGVLDKKDFSDGYTETTDKGCMWFIRQLAINNGGILIYGK